MGKRTSSGVKRTSASVKQTNDLFLRLNPDCIALVFSYLDRFDVGRCELVSRLWKAGVQDWIAIFGFRQHWPDIPRDHVPVDRRSVLGHYKRLATQDFNFRSGRASCARQFSENCSAFSTAGNYAVWYSDNDSRVWWQDISFKPDGSCHPPTCLKGVSPATRISQLVNLYVNADGLIYLGFWEGDAGLTPVAFRSMVFKLDTGERLWQHRRPVPLFGSVCGMRVGCIGKERIYLVEHTLNSTSLVAHDLKTGKLLYQKPAPYSCPSYHRAPFRLYPIQGGMQEFIICINQNFHPARVRGLLTVEILGGDSGEPIQSMHFRWYSWATLSPTRTAPRSDPPTFSLVATPAGATRLRFIENFVLQPDGLFANTSRDAVFLPSDTEELFAIDPSSCRVASMTWECSLHTWILISYPDPEPQDIHEAMATWASDGTAPIGRYFKIVGGGKVSLPPRARHGQRRTFDLPKAERSFLGCREDDPYYLQFLEGGRLLLGRQFLDHPAGCQLVKIWRSPYLFDFLPRNV